MIVETTALGAVIFLAGHAFRDVKEAKRLAVILLAVGGFILLSVMVYLLCGGAGQ